MYFKINCPHCEKSLKVRDELAGRKCACPYCKDSFRIPQQPEPPPEEITEPGFPSMDVSVAPKGRPRGGGPSIKPTKKREESAAGSSAGTWTDSSNVSLIQSGLIGAGASIVFLILIWPLHKFDLKLGQLFWDRGWVPFVLALLLCWSIAILVLKWRKLKRQRQSMLLDVLPTELSPQITLDSLDKFEERIHGLPGESGESFLVNRVIRGLEHFRVRKSAAETVTMMESQSEIDANNVASSDGAVFREAVESPCLSGTHGWRKWAVKLRKSRGRSPGWERGLTRFRKIWPIRSTEPAKRCKCTSRIWNGD
jgi:hypothetical protein